MGLVIVSRFDTVSFTFFFLLFVQVKVFLWSRKGSCHSSRAFVGKEVCICVQKKKGPGANQAGTNSL